MRSRTGLPIVCVLSLCVTGFPFLGCSGAYLTDAGLGGEWSGLPSGTEETGETTEDDMSSPTETDDTTEDGASLEDDSGSSGQAGVLTAGTFDDNLNLDVFRSFVGTVLQAATEGVPSFNLGERAVIRVTNQAGNPVAGAAVSITAAVPVAGDAPLATLITGTDGRAIFSTGIDAAGAGDPTGFTVAALPAGASEPTTISTDLTNLDWQIVVPGEEITIPPAQLDLAFVIDCTGSMGDELEYLKAEVSEIATAVATRFPTVSLRYALVCYRDDGDVYVTRSFDFAEAIEEFQTNLSLQSSDGGGDYPEAVHKAMAAADELSWTSGAVARLLFWIADAPPHAADAQTAFDNLLTLRAKGIRLYPLAASGVAVEAEVLMRVAALLTGGEYIFLTDDSGVGNPHAEPHIPCYLVEYLNKLLIRVIGSELAGERQYPATDDIIRTVGNPVNGVCAATQPADEQ